MSVKRCHNEVSNVSVLPPLDPLHYNADGEMIGHQLVPMDKPIEEVFWCSVCGGHPTDPIHQPGWTPYSEPRPQGKETGNYAMQQKAELKETKEELGGYERLYGWRARWTALATKLEPGRLQSRQERIERRALRCNGQIRALMRCFDSRVGNTVNPV